MSKTKTHYTDRVYVPVGHTFEKEKPKYPKTGYKSSFMVCPFCSAILFTTEVEGFCFPEFMKCEHCNKRFCRGKGHSVYEGKGDLSGHIFVEYSYCGLNGSACCLRLIRFLIRFFSKDKKK